MRKVSFILSGLVLLANVLVAQNAMAFSMNDVSHLTLEDCPGCDAAEEKMLGICDSENMEEDHLSYAVMVHSPVSGDCDCDMKKNNPSSGDLFVLQRSEKESIHAVMLSSLSFSFSFRVRNGQEGIRHLSYGKAPPPQFLMALHTVQQLK